MSEEIGILVIDDDKEIADLVEIYLSSTGYVLYKAYDAFEGLNILEKHEIKLVILDVMMPKMNGLEMCRRIREKRNIPIIFLSAKTSDIDKIQGLNAGADDYMVKPFNPMELLARVKSQLRRYMDLNPAVEADSNQIIVKDVIINTDRHEVTVRGQKVELTPIEFNILQLMAKHPGRVYSTDEIYAYVWNDRIYEANNTVMVHIRRLREKIEENSRKPQLIKTVWGVGYKIEG